MASYRLVSGPPKRDGHWKRSDRFELANVGQSGGRLQTIALHQVEPWKIPADKPTFVRAHVPIQSGMDHAVIPRGKQHLDLAPRASLEVIFFIIESVWKIDRAGMRASD